MSYICRVLICPRAYSSRTYSSRTRLKKILTASKSDVFTEKSGIYERFPCLKQRMAGMPFTCRLDLNAANKSNDSSISTMTDLIDESNDAIHASTWDSIRLHGPHQVAPNLRTTLPGFSVKRRSKSSRVNSSEVQTFEL